MRSTAARSLVYLLLLGALLAAGLWLADALEEGVLPFQRTVTVPSGPVFSPPGGAYDETRRLRLEPTDARSKIIFATGGTVPTRTVGTLYQHPLLLDVAAPGVKVVRAREILGDDLGPVETASYVVGLDHTLPILSLVIDPIDLWDEKQGLLANTWQRGPAWERPVHLTYVDGERTFTALAGLRVHGSERFDAPKQSFRLYFRGEYGPTRLEQPLFPGHPTLEIESYDRLLLQAGDRTGRWTLFEEQLLSEVATAVGGRATQGRFVILFLNGELWGIYRLSERIDDAFVQDNFGIQSADLIRDGDIEEGDAEHWEALIDWVATHDLSDTQNLDYVAARIDLDDFTDYAILQSYFGFPAERFSAVRDRSGGRWFWLYGGWRDGWTPSLVPEATLLTLSPDEADLGLLLHRLLENPSYQRRFIARLTDLLNTALSPEAMLDRVDRLATTLTPDIAYETARWPAPTAWERNVDALREVTRRRPSLLRQEAIDALGLSGTAALSFDATPATGGRVFIGGIPTPESPWTGTYFLDSKVEVTAVPAPGYAFAGWENGLAGTTSAAITLTVEGPRSITAQFVPIPADYPALRPNDVIINELWINDDGTRYRGLDNRPIAGDWLELRVTRPRTVDLRGWRITDNDTKTGTGEGSIILPWIEALAAVPRGTTILIITTEDSANAAYFGQDDLDARDGRMILYVGNGTLDVTTDPGFGIGTGNDNVVLLAPGPSPARGDDVGVDFVAEGEEVTPFSFGVLADGVAFDAPFRGLGADDGALFTQDIHNDDGQTGWIVDPPARQTGDATGLDATNILTPGGANYRQRGRLPLSSILLGVVLAALTATIAVVLLRRARQGELSAPSPSPGRSPNGPQPGGGSGHRANRRR
jgi:hypothetical protein